MMESLRNKSILVTSPESDQVILFAAIVLDVESLDLKRLIANVVMQMSRKQVRAGLLLVGDSTLVLRNTDEEILVDEVDTNELMSLAGIRSTWDADRIVVQVQQWITIMAQIRQKELLGPYRRLLFPEVMSSVVGNIEARDGIWGWAGNHAASMGPQ